MRKIIFLCALIGFNSSTRAQTYSSLFNGKNFEGWYMFIRGSTVGKDPDSIFTIQDNMLHISGKSFGYICTKNSFINFHLVLEFKWGVKKHPPRLNAKRDSGILYYFSASTPDYIWPRSIECQIQEGDCGDFWLVDSTSLTVNGQRYLPTENQQVVKFSDNEKPTGEWNTVEVICLNGKCTHIVNGTIVNEGTDANVHEGKIAIQSEGAEIFYRNIKLLKL